MYSNLTKFLHWAAAALMSLAFALVWVAMLDWHQWAGFLVLLFLFLRLFARLSNSSNSRVVAGVSSSLLRGLPRQTFTR